MARSLSHSLFPKSTHLSSSINERPTSAMELDEMRKERILSQTAFPRYQCKAVTDREKEGLQQEEGAIKGAVSLSPLQ